MFDVQLEPDAQRIFAIHPHGVMSFCHAITYCAPAMLAASPASKRRALGASAIYAIPIVRDIVLACGGVSASREPANRCLKKGYSLTIVPGGEREQLMAAQEEQCVFLKDRKGFCRLALRHGVPLVPCYCFGESELYDQSHFAFGEGG